jgi:hypothetical protein
LQDLGPTFCSIYKNLNPKAEGKAIIHFFFVFQFHTNPYLWGALLLCKNRERTN